MDLAPFFGCGNRCMTIAFGPCGFSFIVDWLLCFPFLYQNINKRITLPWSWCSSSLIPITFLLQNIWLVLFSKWKWAPFFGTNEGRCQMLWLVLYFSSAFQVESDISLHHFGTGIMHLEIYNAQQRTSVKCWKLRRRLKLLLNQLSFFICITKIWSSFWTRCLLL